MADVSDEAYAWRDIASAPKDGGYFIAARFDRDALKWVRHARWSTAEEWADLENGDPDDFQSGWDCDGDEIYPTHWIALLPPALTSEGADHG